MKLEVWAPRAGLVEAVTDSARTPLIHRERGVFVGEIDPGVTYGLSLDGGPVRPDPRSEYQPDGIHGCSQRLDHATFEWSDADWHGFSLSDAIVYELHVGTFTPAATFAGVEERLEHLTDLGVNAIELMPVAAAPGERGWGYDGVALFAVHRAYGGPPGLKHLVDACHARGMAVILDVVYNHLGPDGNYLGEFGPYFSDKHHTPWGAAINVDDEGSWAVRRFILDNALMWMRDYHIDGLRLDATHAIIDDSPTHILAEIALAVRELERETGRMRWVIAESDANDPRLVTSSASGGYGLDGQWCEDFHHALHAYLAGDRAGYYIDFGRLDDIVVALNRGFVYAGQHSEYRGMSHGGLPDGIPLSRFIGYIQNHDQIGNRAVGERIGMLTTTDRQMVAAALVLLSPMTPLLFMGEEWNASTPFLYFTDHTDPELGAAVSDGRAREFASFGWQPADVPDPQDPSTFERSMLQWEERTDAEHSRMLEWYRSLIRLRRDHCVTSPVAPAHVARRAGPEVIVLIRGDLTLVCNCGDIPVGHADVGFGPAAVALASKPAAPGVIPAQTAVIFHTPWNAQPGSVSPPIGASTSPV